MRRQWIVSEANRCQGFCYALGEGFAELPQCRRGQFFEQAKALLVIPSVLQDASTFVHEPSRGGVRRVDQSRARFAERCHLHFESRALIRMGSMAMGCPRASVASQAALNYRSCGIDDAILP